MRQPPVGAVVYLVVMTLWIYGVLNRSTADWTDWFVLVVAVLQILVGFAVGRWWAILLPLLVVAISVPAGFPPITPDNAEPFPIFFGVAFGTLVAVPLIAVGLAARVVAERYGEAR